MGFATSIDTASAKGLTLYVLGYIGATSLAVLFSRAVPERFTARFGNSFLQSFARIGVPVFTFTSLYHWAFPSALSLSEHLADNLVLAVLISWVARIPARTSQ